MLKKIKKKIKRILRSNSKEIKFSEKRINNIMEKTGWSRKKTISKLKDARNRLGASSKEYDLFRLYKTPKNEQLKRYKMLKKKEENVKKVMKETGWDRKYTVHQIDDARKRIGVKSKDYRIHKFYKIPVYEQEFAYKTILRNRKRKENNIQEIMKKTGWKHDYAETQVNNARRNFGITSREYNEYGLYAVPTEKLKAEYRKLSLANKAEKRAARLKKVREKNDKLVEGVMKATGWSKEEAIKKMKESHKQSGASYDNYLTYRFWEKTPEEQSRYYTKKYRRMMKDMYRDPRILSIINNKAMSNDYFNDYLNRPWCINTEVSFEEFKNLFKGTKQIFYKPTKSSKGVGAQLIDINNDIKSAYEKLANLPEGVVEGYVVQHSEMNRLAPTSVNTLRIVSLSSIVPVTEDGKYAEIIFARIRMSSTNSIVDNFSAGGITAAIDLETGELVTDAVSKDGKVFEKHPITGVTIKGFKVPYFNETKELIYRICREKKISGYLGWDVAITQNGPVIIEVNGSPGEITCQIPFLKDNIGIKYEVDKYLDNLTNSYIYKVMKKTGWDYDYAKKQMNETCEKYNISLEDYNEFDFHEIDENRKRKKIKGDNHVLVLARNYTNGIGVIRSLGEKEYIVDLLASANKPRKSRFIAKSKYVNKASEVVSEKDTIKGDLGMLRELLKYAARHDGKVVLFPTDDYTTAIMDEYRNFLTDAYIMPEIKGQNPRKFEEIMDKKFQMDLAKKNGMLIPKTWIVSLKEDIAIPKDVVYPCFCKPIASILGYKTEMLKCANEKDLREHLLTLKRKNPNRSFVIQEFLDIDYELDVSGFSNNGEIFIPAVIKSDYVAEHDKGVMMTGKMVSVDEIQSVNDNIEKMMDNLHYFGIFDIQFSSSNGKLYFNELNLRTVGYNYLYYASGVNFPNIFVKEALGIGHAKEEEIAQVGKTFIYEQVAWDEFLNGKITKKQLDAAITDADVKLLYSDNDAKPEEIFLKMQEKRQQELN